MGQADRLELWFPPGHPAWWWWWCGGDISFHLQPIHTQVGAFLPLGCPYLVSGLQPSKLFPQPRLSPTASFPTSPLPLQSCQSLAEAQAGPSIQDFRASGQDSLPYLGSLLRAPYRLEPHTHEAIVPASLGAEAAGGGAVLPHRLMRPSQWEAAPLASPMGSRPARVTPSHIQFLVSCWRGEDGVFDES